MSHQMRKCSLLLALALSVVGCAGITGPWGNRASGDGWRLLASGTAGALGRAYQVQAATTEEEWLILWRTFDTTNPPPPIDWTAEIVASFAEGISGTCPERRLDDVVIDHVERLVYSVTSDPLAPRMCTADLRGVTYFVIALARPSLPDSPFTLRLREHLICPDRSCGHTEELTVNLGS